MENQICKRTQCPYQEKVQCDLQRSELFTQRKWNIIAKKNMEKKSAIVSSRFIQKGNKTDWQLSLY